MAGGISPESRRRRSRPNPSRPGMFRSVRITSAGKSASLRSASLPSPAVSGNMPQADTRVARPLRWLGSSSTMSTFMGWRNGLALAGSSRYSQARFGTPRSRSFRSDQGRQTAALAGFIVHDEYFYGLAQRSGPCRKLTLFPGPFRDAAVAILHAVVEIKGGHRAQRVVEIGRAHV